MNDKKNNYMLKHLYKKRGYDWWWHSFTGYNKQTGEARAFFIEYFVINPEESPDKPKFGQVRHAKGLIPPSYVMIKAGCWGKNAKQIHNFYPVSQLKIDNKEFSVQIGECLKTEERLVGEVYLSETDALKPEYMSSSGAMSWDLKVEKQITYDVGYGTSWLFRVLKAFQMYWHVPGAKTNYTGTVYLDGEEFAVYPQASFGYADKNWGIDFTNPWLWLASSNLTSILSGKKLQNSCFDIGGGCPKVFGVKLDKNLLVFFSYEGKKYEFNFSKFWKRSSVRFSVSEKEDCLVWSISAENRKVLLDIDVTCPKNEMIFVHYESPEGKKEHNRLWNGGTGRGELRLYKKIRKTLEIIEHAKIESCGCEYGEHP